MSQPFDSRPRRERNAVREGEFTGLLGAAVVAGFYLVVDLARGQALMTPSVLGDAFILHRPVAFGSPDIAAVIVYTVIHVVAFMLFGVALSLLTRASERSALARYGVVQLLVAFLLFFYGAVSIGSEVVRGALPVVGILAANGLAGVVMVGWLWRHHPLLRIALAHTPLGATDAPR